MIVVNTSSKEERRPELLRGSPYELTDLSAVSAFPGSTTDLHVEHVVASSLSICKQHLSRRIVKKLHEPLNSTLNSKAKSEGADR